mmetsp:Transcript_32468/g.68291  ORF Transcript_32468/g.68291 Transcript_32468/m.68291 type:complete len:390 (-) Transcript_32468:558-1727(-)
MRSERDDIVTMSGLNVTLLEDVLWVGCITPSDLPACTWPLMKAMFTAPDDRAGFFSFTQEEDGLTLIMDSFCQEAFEEAVKTSPVRYAPQRWRAFEIHLGTLAWEVPGVVCFLSTKMAERSISILNLSTYDRDFLLVSESDLEQATDVIKESLQRDVGALKEAMQQRDVRLQRPGVSDAAGADEGEGEGLEGTGESEPVAAPQLVGADEAGCSGSSPPHAACHVPFLPKTQPDELFIKVLATKLVVMQMQLPMLQLSTNALVKRLFFSPKAAKSSFWSYTHIECDVSLIIDEPSLCEFPDGAILGSPTFWRAVKLCGRDFAFDETGVVSAMFAPYKERVPLLNISTFSTNITLVEEKDLDRALGAFEDALKIIQADADERESDDPPEGF